MPSGGAVIQRDGVRGAVVYAKYRDSGGRQITERLGREADGWNETKAQRELGKRLAAVEKGDRRPPRLTFV
jgi:protein involved in temperature-dependent protein secretion